MLMWLLRSFPFVVVFSRFSLFVFWCFFLFLSTLRTRSYSVRSQINTLFFSIPFSLISFYTFIIFFSISPLFLSLPLSYIHSTPFPRQPFSFHTMQHIFSSSTFAFTFYFLTWVFVDVFPYVFPYSLVFLILLTSCSLLSSANGTNTRQTEWQTDR